MISICIPSYNQEKTISCAIESALMQDYSPREILVIDDASTDDTFNLCRKFWLLNQEINFYRNKINLGIGGNLTKCMRNARGEFVIFLCGDDIFTHKSVVSDMMEIFKNPEIGVVGRHYYQFLDGYPGAVGVVRDKNILVSSVNPSGIGFRKKAMLGEFSNGVFIEMPSMVKRVLSSWDYRMMDYDTVAVRLHPKNTCTASSYYKESPAESFDSVCPGVVFYESLITIKNRAPRILLREILVMIRIKPLCLLSPKFWACVLVSLIVPGALLRPMSDWWRHRIARRFCAIKYRLRP